MVVLPREQSPNRDKAFEIYIKHGGNIENRAIAEMLGEKEKTISNWKCRDEWNVVLQSKEYSTTKGSVICLRIGNDELTRLVDGRGRKQRMEDKNSFLPDSLEEPGLKFSSCVIGERMVKC